MTNYSSESIIPHKDALDKIIPIAALIRRWHYAGEIPHRHLLLTAEEHLCILGAMRTARPPRSTDIYPPPTPERSNGWTIPHALREF